jgi:hypothetical protein
VGGDSYNTSDIFPENPGLFNVKKNIHREIGVLNSSSRDRAKKSTTEYKLHKI